MAIRCEDCGELRDTTDQADDCAHGDKLRRAARRIAELEARLDEYRTLAESLETSDKTHAALVNEQTGRIAELEASREWWRCEYLREAQRAEERDAWARLWKALAKRWWLRYRSLAKTSATYAGIIGEIERSRQDMQSRLAQAEALLKEARQHIVCSKEGDRVADDILTFLAAEAK